MDLFSYEIFKITLIIVFLASVFNSPILSTANEINTRTKDERSERSSTPEPCCFPYRFRAVIAALPTFSAQKKEVTRLYRDWEARLQIQESVVFSVDGIESSLRKIIMDYRNMVQYMVLGEGGPCQRGPLDYGMLEPCMPEAATYLGKSYVGMDDETTHFDAWYFRRTDHNRNIEMTVAVTSDKCVPVTEHITGTMGAGPVDALVLFTNVTEDVSDEAFNIPLSCLDGPM